jgi:hypothetical protein
MRAEITGFQVPPEIISREHALAEVGYSIRPVTAADLSDLMPFIARNFGWDWVRFAQEYLLELFGPGSDQVCFLVATHQGRIVLLFRCLADMLAKGFHAAWFLWTGADAARLYATAGFKQVRQFAVLKKEI